MSSVILTLLRGSLTFNSIIVVISKYTSLTLYIDGFLNVISLAAISNFVVSQREAWNQGISGGVGIHHLRITHNTPCLPPPPTLPLKILQTHSLLGVSNKTFSELSWVQLIQNLPWAGFFL